MTHSTELLDVIIIGAGLSGIGAAYRLETRCPHKRYVILEGRAEIGGTWDLFRYPGVRSDSDMHTLGYPFRPWKEPEAIADGTRIRNYVRETAREFGIESPHPFSPEGDFRFVVFGKHALDSRSQNRQR